MMTIEETDEILPLRCAAPPRCCSSGESLVGKSREVVGSMRVMLRWRGDRQRPPDCLLRSHRHHQTRRPALASSAGQSGRPFLTCIRYSLYEDVDASRCDVLEAMPGLLRSLVPSRRHCRLKVRNVDCPRRCGCVYVH